MLVSIEPRRKKLCLRSFRSDLTQTVLYSHIKWLMANSELKPRSYSACMVPVHPDEGQLVSDLVENPNDRFSHEAAQFETAGERERERERERETYD